MENYLMQASDASMTIGGDVPRKKAAQQKYGEMLLNGERASYLQKLTIEDDFSYDAEEEEVDGGGSEDEDGLLTSTTTIHADLFEDDFEAAMRSFRQRRQQLQQQQRQQQQAENSGSRGTTPSLSSRNIGTGTTSKLGNGTFSTNYNGNVVSSWRMKDRMKTTSVALVAADAP